MKFNIKDLELACMAVIAPPQQVSPDKRREAEEFIIEFRDKSRLAECQEILLQCQNPQLQFQAALALKASFPRECVQISKQDLQKLIESLLTIVENPNSTSQVREQIIQVIAIAVKRDVGQNKHNVCCKYVLNKIESLAGTNTKPNQVLAASVINALVMEFSGTGKSSMIGLSLAGHAEAKLYFETNELPGIFSLVLNFFKYLNSQPQMLNDPTDQLMISKFLQIGHLILSWQFSKGRASRLALLRADSTVEIPFRPPRSWAQLVTSNDFVALWFSTHGAVRRIPELANLSSNCIQQVCSLKDVFTSPEEETKWTVSIVEAIQRTFPNWIPAQQYESAGLSFALKYLIENRTMNIWKLCSNIITGMLECLTSWTVSMIEHARTSEEYQNGLDYTTDAWIHLLNQFSSYSEETNNLLIPFTLRVWERWLRSKLGSPDGDRLDLNEADEEIDEIEETDNLRFDVQLTAVGMLSRMCVEQSVQISTQLISTRIKQVAAILENNRGDCVVDGLWEDIHWLYLALGHLMADDTDSSESRYIPSEVMKSSLNSKSPVVQNINESTDHVVKVIALLMHCMEMETSIMNNNLTHMWSPQAAQDLRWVLLRVSEAYFYFEEDHHSNMSPSLHGAVGRDTEIGKGLIHKLVDFCLLSLQKWSGEIEILNLSCEILIGNMRRSGPKTKLIALNEQIWMIGEKFCSQRDCIYSRLPPPIQQKLMSVIVYAGAGGGMTTHQYMWKAISPLQSRFQNLAKMSLSNEMARYELTDILERLNGTAMASQPDTASGLAEFLLPFLQQIGGVVEAVRGSSDISVLLFRLNSSLAKYILPYLSDLKCQPFLEAILNLLNLHSKWNKGRGGGNIVNDEFAEELVEILELIANVLNRDVIDLSETDNTNVKTVAASDVAISGLNSILPLIGNQLLEYPPLAESYYNLLNSLCEIYTDKVLVLDSNLLSPLLHSLQLGLSQFGNEIAKTVLEAISALSACIYDQIKVGGDVPDHVINSILPFIRLVFDSLLVHASDVELVPVCSESLFYLICSFPNHFEPVLNEKSQQCTQEQKDKINQSFMPVFQQKKTKSESIKLLEGAVLDIRGLLCIK